MDAEDSFIFHHEELQNTSFPAFQVMRRNGEYCDLLVKVGEKSISAHRMVIDANIPYFHTALASNSSECAPQELTIQKMDPDAVELLIEYAYSGKVKITASNVMTLLSCSKHLQVDTVRDACCDFLSKRLHPNNVLRVREFADNMACIKLVETSDWYVRENFDEVSLCEEFLELPFPYIKELICREDLCVTSEKKVLEAVLKWVKKVPIERKIKLPELLGNIRMPFVTLRYLSDHVANEELIQESMICRDLVDEAKNYHLLPSKKSQYYKFISHPRCIRDRKTTQIHSSVDGIYAVCNLSPSESVVQKFDPRAGEWRVIGTKSDGLYGDTVVGMGRKLYVFGGNASRHVYVLDLETLAWTTVAHPNTERYSSGARAHGGNLYVCGGCDYLGCSLSTAECYDPENNKWTDITNMSVRRHGLQVVALGKYIYALGGKQDATTLSTAEKVMPNYSQKWAELPNMLNRRAGFGASTMNGRIYVCGGTSPTDYISTHSASEVYDPLIDKWYNIANLKISRYRVFLVSHTAKLYTFGGLNQSQYLRSYEIYDSENNQWQLNEVVYTADNCLGIVAINE